MSVPPTAPPSPAPERAGQGAHARVEARRRLLRTRKLHAGHFAFMRAVVQGLDQRESWSRYLRIEGDVTDLRVVRSTIDWIRDEFAAAAKREDRHGTARLVRIDVSRIPEVERALPSLEDFAAERGLEDFSQREQIAAYEEVYGNASRRQSRRGRLVQKQLEALRWLESLIAEPPRAGDAVVSWFNPQLAEYLGLSGIFTLHQLIERVNGLGRRWYGSVRAIGAAKAERIVEWLRVHEDSIGEAIGAHVLQPRSQLFSHELRTVVAPASDIRPLEKLIVPAELDGRAGLYRRPQSQCLLAASNDHEAILAWLRAKTSLAPEQARALKAKRRGRDTGIEHAHDWLSTLSHTQRAYRKEAERFLLWAITTRGKPLSSMTQEDCAAYRDFLADPQPRSRWCGPRNRERWSPLWRPFEGPLSPAGQRQAVTILRNLYAFLVDTNYLMGNPWVTVSIPKGSMPRVNAGRSLTVAQWEFVRNQLEQLGSSSAQRRLRLAVTLLYATGLRISEAVAAKVGDLQWVEYPADRDDEEPVEGWMLRVVGKGQKLREVPVPLDVVAMLADYLGSRGLDLDPEHPDNATAFLIGKANDAAKRAPGLVGEGFDPKEGVAINTLYDQVKGFFQDCADVLKGQGDLKGAERLAKASTHWLRHTHASHAIARGMPVEVAQQNLGHASLATTTVYVTTEQKRRMRAVQGFWGKGS